MLLAHAAGPRARIGVVHIGTIPVMEPEPNLDVEMPLSSVLVSDGRQFSSLCWGERMVFDYPDG